jgi:hypothetical protein
MKNLFVLVAAILAISPLARAHYTFQDSGELLAPGRYAVGSELQFITSGHNDGANILGKFDGGINDELNWRAVVGTGTTDFEISGLLKWVPVPDFEKQPAFGVVGGFMYAHYEHESETSVRLTPFVSKNFEVEIGKLTPYFAVPMSLRSYNNDTNVPVQFAFGSKYEHPEVKGTQFTAEIGINVDKAFSYISVGAIFPLDENNHFQFGQ